MSKRISVMLDDDLLEKLRILQAKRIKRTVKSVSFSKIIGDIIRKDL